MKNSSHLCLVFITVALKFGHFWALNPFGHILIFLYRTELRLECIENLWNVQILHRARQSQGRPALDNQSDKVALMPPLRLIICLLFPRAWLLVKRRSIHGHTIFIRTYIYRPTGSETHPTAAHNVMRSRSRKSILPRFLRQGGTCYQEPRIRLFVPRCRLFWPLTS